VAGVAEEERELEVVLDRLVLAELAEAVGKPAREPQTGR